MNANLIRRIYRIILTIALIVAGLCLMAAAGHIYYTGGAQIYTLEKIDDIFAYIAIPVYVAIILVIGSFVLELFLPLPKKSKPEKNHAMILYKLQQRTDPQSCGDTELRNQVLSLRKQRKTLAVLNLAVPAALLAVFVSYALTCDNYPSLTAGHHEVTHAMVSNALVWGVCTLITLGFAIFAAYSARSGMIHETALLRLMAQQKAPSKAQIRSCNRYLNILRCTTILLAVAMIVIGAVGEGWYDVLTKAAAICTECVGLG